MSELTERIPKDLPTFVCPECLGTIRPTTGGLECFACGLQFSVAEGIPLFAQETESQYGTIARDHLLRIIALCKEQGWERGLRTFLDSLPLAKADFLARYIIPEARAAGKLLLNLDPSAKVLDLGCGSGTLSINLARSVDQVVSVDRGLSQLNLVRLRAKEAGLTNLRLVCAGDRVHLPFPAESFDLVILNGVLEWVGSSRPGNPRALQKAFLMEVNRVLKPEGQVYIGIENRMGYLYLMGARDEHTSIRFVTVMPRPLANLSSLWQTGKPYRVYTYSRWGYRKLLRQAGFLASHIHVPRPHYRDFDEILDGERKTKLDHGFRLKSHLKGPESQWLKARFYRTLAHSFVIIAGKKQLQPSLLEQAIAQLERWLGEQAAPSTKLEALRLRITKTSTAVVSVTDEKRSSSFVLKIPLCPQPRQRLDKNFRVLRALLGALPPRSALRALLPAPVCSLECRGQAVFVECLCPGFDLGRCCRNAADLPKIFQLGLEFLLHLHKEVGESGTPSTATWQEWVAERDTYLKEILPPGSREIWRTLMERAREYLLRVPPAPVWTHGDFWPGNLLVNKAGERLTGVVDWTFSDPEGLPLTDFLFLLLYTKSFSLERGFSHLLAERLTTRRFEEDEKPLIRAYCQELRLPEESVWPLCLMTWADFVYRRNEIHGYLPSWRQREIIDFLDALGPVADSGF